MTRKESYASITSIGDEAAFYSSGTSTHIWIARYSNAFIRVIVWDGGNGKEVGETTINKIIEKVEKVKR